QSREIKHVASGERDRVEQLMLLQRFGIRYTAACSHQNSNLSEHVATDGRTDIDRDARPQPVFEASQGRRVAMAHVQLDLCGKRGGSTRVSHQLELVIAQRTAVDVRRARAGGGP